MVNFINMNLVQSLLKEIPEQIFIESQLTPTKIFELIEQRLTKFNNAFSE